ncbi:MAG: HAMP domain-containing histidine kinase [Elusimicrobia bacterium]|nr:HAMP domain-containing histidine kinase [Elusimicrobiota bacterium]
MRLQAKVLVLVGVSALGQLSAVASFTYLEWRHERFIEMEEDLRRHIAALRDFQASFTELAAGSVAALVMRHERELGELILRSAAQEGVLEPLSGYGAYRNLKNTYEDYLGSLRLMMEEIAQGSFSKNPQKIVVEISELKTKEATLLKLLQAVSDEAWSGLRRQEELGDQQMRWAHWVLFAMSGILLALSMVLALLWISDLRRAFESVEKGLLSLGRGDLPSNPMPRRADEMGIVLKAIERVGRQSRDLQQTMIRWDRLAAMGQLAGGVAHEINNPLVGVLGQAELLKERLGPDHPAGAQVEKIVSAAQRCRKIVRNLLDFARQRDHEFQRVTFDKILESVMDMVKSDLEKTGVQIIPEIDPALPSIYGSPVDLAEALLNLVMNAKDAMPTGGRLFIRARTENDRVRIEVEDTGAGIPSHVMPRIFEAFYTTKELGKGTGLGLSVSYGIVKNHKGQIYAESPGEGKGSKFTILLPMTEAGAVEAAKGPQNKA